MRTNSYSFLLEDVFNDYIKNNKDIKTKSIETIIGDLIRLTNNRVDLHNQEVVKSGIISKSKFFKSLTDLHPYYTAQLAMIRCHFVNISYGGFIKEKSKLAVYQEDGFMKGLYSFSEYSFRDIIYSIQPTTSLSEYNWIIKYIKFFTAEKKVNDNPDLVAVNNGIFNYKTKKLLPFNPDYIFLSKSEINYNKYVKDISIKLPSGKFWNIDSFF